MKILKLLTKIIAVIMLVRGLLLVLGSILFGIDVIKGMAQMKPTLYIQFPYYVLLVISAVGILRSKKWGVYLLFSLLAFDLFYWIVLGYYPPLIRMALAAQHSFVKVYGLLMIFCKRLLVPLTLFIYFSLSKVREGFAK